MRWSRPVNSKALRILPSLCACTKPYLPHPSAVDPLICYNRTNSSNGRHKVKGVMQSLAHALLTSFNSRSAQVLFCRLMALGTRSTACCRSGMSPWTPTVTQTPTSPRTALLQTSSSPKEAASCPASAIYIADSFAQLSPVHDLCVGHTDANSGSVRSHMNP